MDELRLIDLARYLGVSKQRAHQLASEPGFPHLACGGDRGVGSAKLVGLQALAVSMTGLRTRLGSMIVWSLCAPSRYG
jgi:hypothetical protein